MRIILLQDLDGEVATVAFFDDRLHNRSNVAQIADFVSHRAGVVVQLVETVVAVMVDRTVVIVLAADEHVARFDVHVSQLLRVDVVQPFRNLFIQKKTFHIESFHSIQSVEHGPSASSKNSRPKRVRQISKLLLSDKLTIANIPSRAFFNKNNY